MENFYRERQRTARNEQICSLCGCAIHRWQEYVHTKGTRDGKFFQARYHIHCHALREACCKECNDPYTPDAEVRRWIGDVCEGCSMATSCYDREVIPQECKNILNAKLNGVRLTAAEYSADDTRCWREKG